MKAEDKLVIVPLTDFSAEYDYNTIVQEVPEIKDLSPELALEFIELVQSATEAGMPVAFAGGHGYERKDHLSYDSLGGRRNGGYGSGTDEVFLQVTVRVEYDLAAPFLAKFAESKISKEKSALEAERSRIDAQIAELEERRAKL